LLRRLVTAGSAAWCGSFYLTANQQRREILGIVGTTGTHLSGYGAKSRCYSI